MNRKQSVLVCIFCVIYDLVDKKTGSFSGSFVNLE